MGKTYSVVISTALYYICTLYNTSDGGLVAPPARSARVTGLSKLVWCMLGLEAPNDQARDREYVMNPE